MAALAGAFLTLAIVMGEFTIANLAAFHTFPIYIQYINETKAYPAAAVSLLSFGITWAAMLALLLVGRRGGAHGARGHRRRRGADGSPRAPGAASLVRHGRRARRDRPPLEKGEFVSLLGP